MRRGRQNKAQDDSRGTRKRRPLVAHPLFAAVLGIWGAALGGLVTLVLPRALVLQAAADAGLAQLGTKGPFVFAALVATLLGGVLFALAGVASRAKARSLRVADHPSLAAKAMRHVRTIDPASDLGSSRLDDPVETMPFARPEPEVAPVAGDLASVDEDFDADWPGDETGADAEAVTAPLAEPTEPAPPLELDLAQFAALPGRNAVWVEEPLAAESVPAPETEAETEAGAEPASEPAPAAPAWTPRPLAPSAIESLRAVPTSELSLVQMVERFAAALHEHQSAPPARSGSHDNQAGRDAALAEALKALAALTPAPDSGAQGEPLRAALTRLQELRGAA